MILIHFMLLMPCLADFPDNKITYKMQTIIYKKQKKIFQFLTRFPVGVEICIVFGDDPDLIPEDSGRMECECLISAAIGLALLEPIDPDCNCRITSSFFRFGASFMTG